MGISLVGSDLLYIVAMANHSGRMAVIEDQKVAIFTPVMTEIDGGFRHVGFHIDQVQTVGEAQAVLRSTQGDRHAPWEAEAEILEELP
jgi:hypothetical protein